MDVSISSKLDNDLVLIKASGTVADLEELKLLMKKYYDEIAPHGMNKILVDEREVQFPSSLEQASLVVDFFSDALPCEIRSWKVAAVVSNDIKEIAEFWEFQANQRGYPFKIFSSLEEARAFLCG